jgi:hypothetical protein
VNLPQRKVIHMENPLLNGLDMRFVPEFMSLLEEPGKKAPAK